MIVLLFENEKNIPNELLKKVELSIIVSFVLIVKPYRPSSSPKVV